MQPIRVRTPTLFIKVSFPKHGTETFINTEQCRSTLHKRPIYISLGGVKLDFFPVMALARLSVKWLKVSSKLHKTEEWTWDFFLSASPWDALERPFSLIHFFLVKLHEWIYEYTKTSLSCIVFFSVQLWHTIYLKTDLQESVWNYKTVWKALYTSSSKAPKVNLPSNSVKGIVVVRDCGKHASQCLRATEQGLTQGYIDTWTPYRGH